MERSTAMEGFFGKKQYAAKAASVLTAHPIYLEENFLILQKIYTFVS